jgi:DNA polymerase-1
MQTGQKVLLIDAYAIIYRSFFAFQKNPRINSRGENTSAIFGFVNSVEEVIRRVEPQYVAVGFDPSGKTFRHEIYDAYKAQREKTPEVITWSVPWIQKILDAMEIPIVEVAGFEADDVIGTMAKRLEDKGYTTYMFTPDKDYGQLVSDQIYMYKPRHASNQYEVLGINEINERYGLASPLQMIDYLGLVGDASDNIPGCPGVGEVTAKKLLSQFGSIDEIIAHAGELKGALSEKISKNVEQIKLSQYLATIRTDVPIDLDRILCKERNKGFDPRKLEEIYRHLEFRNFVSKIAQKEVLPKMEKKKEQQYSLWDTPENAQEIQRISSTKNGQIQSDENPEIPTYGEGDSKKSILKSLKNSPHSYYLIESEAEIAALFEKISLQKIIAFDTETSDIDPIRAEIVGISFCWQAHEAYYIPLGVHKEKILRQHVKPILENKASTKVGQNVKYDTIVLKKYGIEVEGPIFDTMVAHYLLEPDQRHNMDFLAEKYLNYETIHIEEIIGAKGKHQKNMKDLSPTEVYEYAAEDADITFQLYEFFRRTIDESDLQELCYDIEMPLVRVLADMEGTGVRIDQDTLKQSSTTLNQKLIEIEQEIQNIAGCTFNVNSPKQIGEVLFEKMNIDAKAKKTKSGQYSTSEDVLEKIKSKHPIVEKILEQRQVKKLVSTYIDALPELVNPQTGKIHTTYNQTVTATGRLSSSNPNLQNIPVREALGREIRKAFAAKEGEVFLSADYSQIELRLMAHLSGDENMIDAFQKGQDIHTATAAKIYKTPLQEVVPEMRRRAKTANFGIIYGISAFGLAERMGVTRTEAKELIDGYFETYPGVKKYMEDCIQVAKEKGWVETLFRRKRFLPDIHSQNGNVRGYAERNAINAPIQGTAADIIKVAMVRIHAALKQGGYQTQMVMQVHDELNFIVPQAEINAVKEMVRYEMEHALSLNVPLTVDLGIGQNWLEAHS